MDGVLRDVIHYGGGNCVTCDIDGDSNNAVLIPKGMAGADILHPPLGDDASPPGRYSKQSIT
jgi:hypothetical protein